VRKRVATVRHSVTSVLHNNTVVSACALSHSLLLSAHLSHSLWTYIEIIEIVGLHAHGVGKISGLDDVAMFTVRGLRLRAVSNEVSIGGFVFHKRTDKCPARVEIVPRALLFDIIMSLKFKRPIFLSDIRC